MTEKDRHGKKAVALKYRHGQDRAPRVVAEGRGILAEKIISIARANQVPCIEDAQLVEALAGLGIDAEIPPELYLAVAEVLAFVYRLEMESKTEDR